jgi:hypothetical protein
MAWEFSNVTKNSSLPLKEAWGTYSYQRRKLVVTCRVAPVRPVFEKLAVGPAALVRPVSLTGRTNQDRVTPKTFSFTPTLHQINEVAQVMLGGVISTL